MSLINVENPGESRVLVTVTNLSAQPIRVLNEGSSRLVVNNQAAPVVNVTIRKSDAPRILVGGGQPQTTVRAVNQGAPRITVRVPGIQGASGAGAEDFADIQAQINVINTLALQNKQDLQNHENDVGNPHNTTAVQVGADPVGSAAAAQAFAIQRENHTGMQAQSTIINLVDDLGNKADLVGGVIPTSQLPALAITDFLGEVANEAAMLALVGQKGDWVIRTDLSQTAIITGENPALLASWTFLSYPAAPVSSVNGQIGVVVLSKADVGLGSVDNTSDMAKPVSTAQAAAIALKQNADPTLAALADLDAVAGMVEQTGFDAFTKRPIGVAFAYALLTRADGDTRYDPDGAADAAEAAANTYTDAQVATRQPLSSELTAYASLGTTGFLRRVGAATITAAALIAADIPALDASKITSGTFADAQISASSVVQHEGVLTINYSQLVGTPPPLLVSKVRVAADEAAMLALVSEEGDIVIRSDESKSYAHNGGTAGTMADWYELLNPAAAGSVLSFNTRTGAVTLLSSDVTGALGYTPLDSASYTAADVLTKLLTVDGPGSGLDADTLDGVNAASFQLASGYTAADVLAKLITVDGASSGLDADLLDGQQGTYYTDIVARLGYTPLNSTAYTAADVLAKLITVDGAGSNVDADLLDGQQGSYYAAASSLSGYLPLSNGSHTLSATTDWRIAAGTADGADTLILRMVAGGAFSTTRGAIFELHGANSGAANQGGFRLLGNGPGTVTMGANTVTFQTSTYNFTGPLQYGGVIVATQARDLIAGNGLTGGGTLAADRTFTLGTPSTLTHSTTNTVTATSHTHALSLVYNLTLAADLPSTYPITAPTMGQVNSGTGWPTTNGTVLNVITDTAGNRAFQFHAQVKGGANVPVVSVRSHHSTDGGGGWTGFYELWHTGNDGSGSGLDADTLDGAQPESSAATASTIAARNGSGDIFARLFRSTFANQASISGAMAFRVNNSGDEYIRFCSDTAAIRTFLAAPGLASINQFTDGQRIIVNVPAINNAAYGDGHLELRTLDGSLPRLGFHRSGTDAIALYYNGTSDLRLRQNTGGDYAVWHSGNLLNIGTTAASARTALALGTAATVNTGTSGATIPLLSTANTFSQNQTVNVASSLGDWIISVAGVQAGGIFADTATPRACFYGSAGSTLLFRPQGRGSATGQMTLDSGGNLTVAANIYSAQNFISAGGSVVLATTGAASVLLRPNGVGSGTGEASLTSAGVFTAPTVADSIGNVRDIPPVLRNSTAAFTSADRGKVIYKDNTTAYTWTINTGATAGWAIMVKNRGTAGNITIAKGAGMTNLYDDTGAVASYALLPGQSRLLVCISSTEWWVM